MSATPPVVVVTGGARGIGRAFVVEAVRRGHPVLFTQRAPVVEDVFADGVRGLSVDLTVAGAAKTVAAAARELGPVGTLVNNAGYLINGSVGEVDLAAWQQSFLLHATVPMLLARSLVDDLRRTRGAILNVSSTGGVVGSLHSAAYGASKAATIGLSKSLARELAPDVRVNTLAPGPVATDMWDSIDPTERAELEAETPLGRVARPEEMAKVGLDVCAWTYVTGQTIVADGGRVLS